MTNDGRAYYNLIMATRTYQRGCWHAIMSMTKLPLTSAISCGAMKKSMN